MQKMSETETARNPANRLRTGGRDAAGRFLPGQSGNPSGRPRRLETEAETLAAICGLAPLAVQRLTEILQDQTVKPDIALRAVEIVFTRIMGTEMTREQIIDREISPANIAEYLKRERAVAQEYY